MPRPKRPRWIMARPAVNGFAPEGAQEKEAVILSLEELEAIRHIDYEGLDQSQAAQIMNVSRQTVGRILKTARFNLSKALVTGCPLKIEGGCYTIRNRQTEYGHHGRGRGRRRTLCGTGRGTAKD